MRGNAISTNMKLPNEINFGTFLGVESSSFFRSFKKKGVLERLENIPGLE